MSAPLWGAEARRPRRHGTRPVATGCWRGNWRCARGEIDLICEWADAQRVSVLVVCEVKSRSSGSFGHALEAVTSGKRRRLRGLAVSYLRSQRRGYDEIRFDVVGVTPAGLVVVEGAF